MAKWDWTRYWILAKESHVLRSSTWLRVPLDSRFLKLEELEDRRLLVLLGDPGMGKTTEIEKAVRNTKNGATAQDTVLHFDARELLHTEASLQKYWFDGARWNSAINSSGTIWVYFDGFDESARKISNLSGIIREELRSAFEEHPDLRNRLKLRFVSRPVGWDSGLAAFARELFSEDEREDIESHSIEEYFLSPLTVDDVKSAAASEGIEVKRFVQALQQQDIESLAIRPPHLQWLLNRYKNSGTLPDSKADLFWEGMYQVAASEGATNNPDMLRALSGRIAFLSMFGNKPILSPADSRGIISSDILFMRDAEGGTESTTVGEVDASLVPLNETLHSGFFSAVSEGKVVWGHQSYPEFLAAKYLADLDLPIEQKLALLANPNDAERRIIPLLSEVAAWSASLDPRMLAALIDLDPERLVLSDVALNDKEARTALARGFLESLERGSIVPSRWYYHSELENLNGDHLHQTLLPFIANRSLKPKTRDIAIDIAIAGKVTTLANVIAEVALDPDNPEYLRRGAAYFVSRLGNDSSKEALLPLIDQEIADDPAQNLKGYALISNWPDRLSVSEVIEVFSPPRSEIIGAYNEFLQSHFIQLLDQPQVAAVLKWWTEQSPWSTDDYHARSFERTLVSHAVRLLDDDSVRESLSRLLYRNFKEHYYLFIDNRLPEAYEQVVATPEIRRKLVVAVLSNVPDEDEAGNDLRLFIGLYAGHLDWAQEDVPWIAGKVRENSGNSSLQRFWLQLLRATNAPELILLDSFFSLQTKIEEAGMTEELLGPIDIRSKRAKDAKRSWEVFHARSDDETDVEDIVSLMIDKVASYVSLAETKHPSWWWKIDQAIQSEGSTYFPLALGTPSISLLPGWQSIPEDLKQRIVDQAVPFLQTLEPDLEILGTSQFSYADNSAVRALNILAEERPESLERLSCAQWQNLGPAILFFPLEHAYEEQRFRTPFLQKAIDHGFQPTSLITKMARSDAPDRSNDLNYALEAYAPFANKESVSELISQLVEASAHRYAVHQILRIWREYVGPDLIQSLFTRLIQSNYSATDRGFIASVLLEDISADEWAELKAHLFIEQDVLKTAFQSYDNWARRSVGFSDPLNERDLSELYEQLVAVFPPSEDPSEIGVHTVTPRERVGNLRESILQQLANKSTWLAVDEIDRLRHTLPDIEWLPKRKAEAQHNARSAQWQPPSLDQLLGLARSKESRIIRTPQQLMEVTMESLERLETELQGESPLVEGLWNTNDPIQPKNETRISDQIRGLLLRDFQSRGIVIDREVQNRPGNEVDVYIQYRDQDSPDSLVVVCEVKCCFNGELHTSMELQLLNRYMRDQGNTCGIYIVPFFDCDAWENKNRGSRHKPRKHTLEGLTAQLNEQAQNLSDQEYIVRAYVLDCRLK